MVPPGSARAPRILRLTQVLAPHKKRSLHLRDSHPLRWIVPDHFCFTLPLCEISPCEPYNPAPTRSAVWATPLSLAATYGISFDFSSSRYLDVSVPWVYLHKAIYSLYDTWGFPCEFPHSEIFGSLTMCVYPKLIAAYRVLHRLLMPRHSPYALCSLTIFAHLTLHYCFIKPLNLVCNIIYSDIY